MSDNIEIVESLQLLALEEAFRGLNGDLSIRPVFHQYEKRKEKVLRLVRGYANTIEPSG